MNEREKILEFTISEYETYIIALKKYGSSDDVTKCFTHHGKRLQSYAKS